MFLHLFAKSEKGNLTAHESEAYRDFANVLDSLSDVAFQDLVVTRGWLELDHDGR